LKNRTIVLFRTAGGKAKNRQLGLGHIFRVINIAKKLEKNCEIYFLIEDFGGVEKILKSHNFFNIKKITNDINLEKDLEITSDTIKKISAEVLVVDHYGVKNKYLSIMKKKIKTVLITDLKKFNFDADLVTNGFIGFKNKIFKNNFGAKCLLGPKYQILNKNFHNKNIKLNSKFRILVTFGGYDEKQISTVVVNSLKVFLDRIELKIILGPAAKITNELKNLNKKYPNQIIIQKDVKNMHKEILKSSFGICSGGLTTYEFAAMGIPFIMICDDNHQLITAKEWNKRKIGINLGIVNENTKKRLNLKIEKILNNKIKLKNRINLVDGLGSERIANEILKI
jgi:UDP-2,4-diacetamido-2,4,6-trideoxy-beta-L-altropyranose hydrolase